MSRFSTNEWNTGGTGSMFDKFGQNERTGVGGRSALAGGGPRRAGDDVALREQLLEELSVLRRRHDNIQLRNRSSMLESPPPALASPPLNHAESTFLSSAHLIPQSQGSSYFYGGAHQQQASISTHTPMSMNGAGGVPLPAHQFVPDEKAVLGQSDKDAIEALFAVDDFAEIFNAGGNVSNLPPPVVHQPPASSAHLEPVCHMCCRKLRPSDVAAYVNPAAFDPSKPTARRSNNKVKPK